MLQIIGYLKIVILFEIYNMIKLLISESLLERPGLQGISIG